jgi:hypothetical protein
MGQRGSEPEKAGSVPVKRGRGGIVEGTRPSQEPQCLTAGMRYTGASL